MSTGIEWTDETWNPVTGCTKVSEGCDHCYAERITERFHGKGSFAEVKLHPDRLDLPLRWRKPRMVFVNSMSDLFHDSVPLDFIARVFGVMARAQEHTFQVLTKRPGRMASLLAQSEVPKQMAEEELYRHLLDDHRDWLNRSDPAIAAHHTWLHVNGGCDHDLSREPSPWPLPNVWLGTSVETQKWADVRIPQLLRAPAAVRFLSCEPLLGPVDLSSWVFPFDPCPHCGSGVCFTARIPGSLRCGNTDKVIPERVDWVIAGGESGTGARPMHPDWPRSLRDQCQAAGVPFFMKQDSGRRSGQQGRLPDKLWAVKEFPRAG